MTTHSNILAWRIPWTQEPGRLQSMGHKEPDMTERISSRPGHRALARSSLLRDWFPCAGAVLSLAQTHRGRPHVNYTVRGILQARILEWVAFPFSRGSSQPRD